MALCFDTVSVKRTKTESTIWLNRFIKSVLAEPERFKTRSDDQLIMFSKPQDSSVHTECSEFSVHKIFIFIYFPVQFFLQYMAIIVIVDVLLLYSNLFGFLNTSVNVI